MYATFNFSIVLFAAQVNRKIESDIEFSGSCDQVTLARHRVVVLTRNMLKLEITDALARDETDR